MRVGIIVCDAGGGWEDAKMSRACEPKQFVGDKNSNPPSDGLGWCQQKCTADEDCAGIFGNAVTDQGDQSCYTCGTTGFREVNGNTYMMRRVRDYSNVGVDGCMGTYWCQELL